MLVRAQPDAPSMRPLSVRQPKAAAPRPDRRSPGLAELMLLNRLRARNRPDLTSQTLERAAHIIAVTSRHWFGLLPAQSV
jgi:hypothetical protein